MEPPLLREGLLYRLRPSNGRSQSEQRPIAPLDAREEALRYRMFHVMASQFRFPPTVYSAFAYRVSRRIARNVRGRVLRPLERMFCFANGRQSGEIEGKKKRIALFSKIPRNQEEGTVFQRVDDVFFFNVCVEIAVSPSEMRRRMIAHQSILENVSPSTPLSSFFSVRDVYRFLFFKLPLNECFSRSPYWPPFFE